MTRIHASLIIIWLLALGLLISLGLTVLNPAWVLRQRFPSAVLHINRIDSPERYFWAEFGELIGIPMSAPNRYLNVEIDHYQGDLSLDDLTEVSSLHISNSRVVDISAYVRKPGLLMCPVFKDCDFTGLPDSQRDWLARYAPNPESPDAYPNTFWIPFESHSFRQSDYPLSF